LKTSVVPADWRLQCH